MRHHWSNKYNIAGGVNVAWFEGGKQHIWKNDCNMAGEKCNVNGEVNTSGRNNDETKSEQCTF